MKKRKGFTLAELLIVVAIIAILVAVSIPVLNSQLEKAKEATDLANIRAGYEKIAETALSQWEIPDASKADKYNEVFDPGTDGEYEIWVKITQGRSDWQNYSSSVYYVAGNSVTVSKDKDHWVIHFNENTQKFTIYEDGTATK